MVNPQTVNVGIIVPLTGADVDTWGVVDVNPNMVAIDGLFAGVQTIAVTNAPVTLTAPAGFTATPTPGPTQSQNRVLRFTGTLTADVRITLPLPGSYIIENLTTGAHVLSFQGVTASEVIGTPQGERLEIYSDGANVRFVGLNRVGATELWAGLTAIPAWVTQCTVKPYLLCDGGVYNYADYVALSARLAGAFGGNGITTFGVPDLQGRVPLAYDGTGVRITVAGCGINGQALGASQDKQTNVLLTANLPPYTPAGAVASTPVLSDPNAYFARQNVLFNAATGGGTVYAYPGLPASAVLTVTSAFTGAAQGGTSAPINNVQPAQVVGVWVIKT